MKTSIFIKTWTGDLPWLEYCLQSIRKYASGIEEVVVVSDGSCYPQVRTIAHSESVFEVEDWENGYIQQQWIKLNADSYTASEQILFVDSDCIFHTPFSPESFMREGKPILMKTRYGNLGGAEAWKAITEQAVGFPVEFEYMRRLPWMYRAESLKQFRRTYPETGVKLLGMTDRSFSEFNALGAFIDRFENEDYYVTDTEVWIPESVAKQYWSWAGVTQENREEIEGYLGVRSAV